MIKVLFLICFIYITFAWKLFDREEAPSGWTMLARAEQHARIKLRIALRQHNLDKLEDIVLTKSDPTSESYGKHLSVEQVLRLIAPPPAEVEPVLQWLRVHRVTFRLIGDVIKVEASVVQVEDMFSTEMHIYQHENGKQRIFNHGPAHIPDHLSHVITLVAGLTEFPFYKELRIGAPDNVTDPGIIVPELLQFLYRTPAKFHVHPNSSLCLAEFMDDASFSKKDLKEFEKLMDVPSFSPSHIVGPYDGSNPDAESTLDVQYPSLYIYFAILLHDYLISVRYGGSMVLDTSLWFWTVDGWMYEFATDLFNSDPAPLVVSMSWGWPEPAQCQTGLGNCTERGWTSADYVARVNTEFMKIVARGITLVAASGDQGIPSLLSIRLTILPPLSSGVTNGLIGAPGDLNPGCNTSGDDVLSNLFPASSPWVTAVGATMLVSATTDLDYKLPPICKDLHCAKNGTEVVCTIPEALITSGGGFSTYSSVPSWQAKQVKDYLNSNVTLPPRKYYNSTNRAYPDISALGHNFVIQWGGMAIQVDGTSCSSPVVAAMIALLNSARLNAGKPSLGFVNPLLYAAATNNTMIFNDFTTGNNKCTENCCGTVGFEATAGWDPVTGLGSPNFPALLQYVTQLP